MYSQAVKVTGTETILFIAGQVAYGQEGAPTHAGDFEKAQAEAGGDTMANIVRLDRHPAARRLRPIREEFFGKKMPARGCRKPPQKQRPVGED